MTTAAPNAKPGKLSKPIRLFSTGWVEDAKGREYFGPKELDRIVRNFETLSKGWTANNREQRLHNPAVYVPANVAIGHDEDQAFAKALLGRSDNPAAGWVSRMWRDGEYLMGEVDSVPPEVRKEIEDGRLRTWSAEIYRDFQDDGGKSWGPTFRRLAFLGGDIPKRKDLGTLPPVVLMSEMGRPSVGWRTRLVKAAGNLLLCFSEGYTVDRNAMLAALQQAGVDTAGITDAVSDETLASIVKAMSKPMDNSEPPMGGKEKPAPFTEPDPEKKKDEAAMFSERIKPLIEAAVAPLKTQIHNLKAELTAKEKKASENEVAVFCESMTAAGKLPPAEKDSAIAIGKSLIGTAAYDVWHKALKDRNPMVAMHSERIPAPAETEAGKAELDRLRAKLSHKK